MKTTTKKNSRKIFQELEKKFQQDPKNSELALNLGEAALRLGQCAEAEAFYKRAVELDPRIDLRATFYQWAGLYHEARGELNEALEAWRKWSELEPGVLEPVDRQARILVVMARWTDLFLLRPVYSRLAEHGVPHARESLALYSFLAQQLGRGEEVSVLDRTYMALEHDSQSLAMRYLLGIVLMRTGQPDTAEKEFQRVVELDPEERWQEVRFNLNWDTSGARLMLARIARMKGNQALALELLQSVGARGVTAEGLDEMATLLLDNGRYAELLDLLAISPDDGEVPDWVERCKAVAMLGLGRLREAEELFVASRRRPDDRSLPQPVDSLPLELEFLLEEGHFEELLAKLPEAPSTPHTRWAEARALAGLQRWEEAEVLLGTLLREQPEFREAWDLMAYVSQAMGRMEAAQLATIQAETLRQRETPARARGFLWPAGPDSSFQGLRFLASSRPGKGDLRVTGPAARSVEQLARYALTLIQPHCDAYSLEDPSYRDIHLHAVTLGRTPRDRRADELPVDEEAGAAILCALVQALAGPHLSAPSWVMYGRLELDGRLRGPLDLSGSFRSLQGLGAGWERLVLPQTAAPELLEIPSGWWLGMPILFCDSVEQLIESLTSLRVVG